MEANKKETKDQFKDKQVEKKWLERVQNVQIIYSYLIEKKDNSLAFAQQFLHGILTKYKLNLFQVRVLEYVFNNFGFIQDEIIKPNIKESWYIEQINLVNIAIIAEAYSEFNVNQTPKSVLIDQSIITTKNFCDDGDYKFINAILDKILK